MCRRGGGGGGGDSIPMHVQLSVCEVLSILLCYCCHSSHMIGGGGGGRGKGRG